MKYRENAMKPKVFSVTSVEEIGPYLQSVRQEGLAPTLAIVFSSIVHNLEELKATFAKYDIEVFGATSSGEITNDEVHEDSISVMLLEMSRDAYRLNVFDGEGKTSSEVGQAVGKWAKTIYDNPASMLMSRTSRRRRADRQRIHLHHGTPGTTVWLSCRRWRPSNSNGRYICF